MLTSYDLLTCDKYVNLQDISLELYREFSESFLMKRRFHYYFTDGTDIVVEFKEFCVRHMLGVHHINPKIKKNELFQRIRDGLTLNDFEVDARMRKAYKNCKPRIRMFACVYNMLRCGRIFHCVNQFIPNTTDVKMDYILYREVGNKGFHLGIREELGAYLPLTILVGKEIYKDKYVDYSCEKIVSRLIISEIDSNKILEDIVYSDNFIMSDGIK